MILNDISLEDGPQKSMDLMGSLPFCSLHVKSFQTNWASIHFLFEAYARRSHFYKQTSIFGVEKTELKNLFTISLFCLYRQMVLDWNQVTQ